MVETKLFLVESVETKKKLGSNTDEQNLLWSSRSKHGVFALNKVELNFIRSSLLIFLKLFVSKSIIIEIVFLGLIFFGQKFSWWNCFSLVKHDRKFLSPSKIFLVKTCQKLYTNVHSRNFDNLGRVGINLT